MLSLRITLIALSYLVISFHALAQFQISGQIKDANNQPLSGATVEIIDTFYRTITDDSGHFQLFKVPAGSQKLFIRHLGFETYSQSVLLSEDMDMVIIMNEALLVTDEVIVRATRATGETPTTYSTLERKEIQDQNFGQDLPYLLNWTPSVVTTSDAGMGIGYTGIRIRGNDATRINVTINGIPYNDSESLGTFWVDVPDIASSSQSIQIQRGVGTSTNGPGSFGGTVNLQTSTLNKTPYIEFRTSAGSFNTFRNTIASGTGLINDHWSFDVRASKINSDGYIDRSSSDLKSYYLSGGYYGKRSMIKMISFGGQERTYQSWYGLDPDMMTQDRTFNYAGAIYGANGNILRYYDNQVDDYQQDHTQLHFSHTLNTQWNLNVSLHHTYGRGYYEEYNQQVSYSDLGLQNIDLGDTIITASDIITRKWLDNHFYGGTFSLNHNVDKVDITMGGGWHRYSPAKHFGEIRWAEHINQPLGYHFYDGLSHKVDFNIYGKLAYNFTEKLYGFVDLQYRTVTYTTEGIDDYQNPYNVDDQFDFFNPKAGITYRINPLNHFYLSYAVAHREPVRSDYLDGDATPKPEQLRNLEIGWRKSSQPIQLEINYYLMNYIDQLVFTGELNNVGAPVRENAGKSVRTGIEISALYLLSEKLTWTLNATVSSNQNIDYFWIDQNDEPVTQNTQIVLSPNFIGGSSFIWKPHPHFEINLLSKCVGKQYLNNTENEDLTLPSYFVQDVRFSFQPKLAFTRSFQVSLLVNNVLDAKYASNGYDYDGIPYVYPQAGIHFLAMVAVGF